MNCNLCPRQCNTDRSMSPYGYCGYPEGIYISCTMLHMWEEPCISGTRGSGAVFFCGCSLRCIYCQNSKIAMNVSGRRLTPEELAEEFVALEESGAHNINLVTPTHFSVGIADAIDKARQKGLKIPIVYNTGGYELKKCINPLDGRIDIYLTDFKYINPNTASKYSGAPDYPEFAKEALEEMVRQKPMPVFDNDGIMQSGVIVRHLLLPGSLANSKAVIEYLYKTYGDSIYISIMNQYTPIRKFEDYPELSETPSQREYDKLVDYALSLGIKNAYIQDEGCSDTRYIPEFS